MTRNLWKEINTRSRFRNKFCKNPTKENKKLYKNSVAFRRKCIKEYFHDISNNIVTNKNFWNFIRPFLVNKDLLNSSQIMLRNKKKIVTDNREIVQVLNDHYINIVEKSCGKKPTSAAKQSHLTDDIKIVNHIVRHYEDHPSLRYIKKTLTLIENRTTRRMCL